MPRKSNIPVIERYKCLVEVLQDLSVILNNDQLVEHIVKSAARLSDANVSWLLRSDQPNQSLRFETSNLPNNPKYRNLVIPFESSLEGWVIMNLKPVIINDTHLYDHSYGNVVNVTNIKIKSILSIPLISKDKTIGVLEVINNRTGNFNQTDLEILAAFAGQVAIYIDNIHLFQQSDLISELVHELRTPLASLNTAFHLLQRTDLPDNKRIRISEMINTEFSRLTDLTTSFLDYARLESGRAKFQISRFDLNQLLTESIEVFQMQADSSGIKINLDIPNSPLMISADKDKIKQVIYNLLNNAIKYNHLNGNIYVNATGTPIDLSFSIRNDGNGIPPEYIPHLFERFFRAPENEYLTIGTGLGLNICKQIVEAHKGKIEVTSVVGQWTTFTIRLPAILDD